MREFGKAHAVDRPAFDLEHFAAAVGVRYRKLDGDAAAGLRPAVESGKPTLIDVSVRDSLAIHRLHARSAVRETVRGAVGPDIVNWLKRRLR